MIKLLKRIEDYIKRWASCKKYRRNIYEYYSWKEVPRKEGVPFFFRLKEKKEFQPTFSLYTLFPVFWSFSKCFGWFIGRINWCFAKSPITDGNWMADGLEVGRDPVLELVRFRNFSALGDFDDAANLDIPGHTGFLKRVHKLFHSFIFSSSSVNVIASQISLCIKYYYYSVIVELLLLSC